MGSPQETCGHTTGKEGVRERIGKQKLENRNSGNKRPEAKVKVLVPRFEGKEPARVALCSSGQAGATGAGIGEEPQGANRGIGNCIEGRDLCVGKRN